MAENLAISSGEAVFMDVWPGDAGTFVTFLQGVEALLLSAGNMNIKSPAAQPKAQL